MVLRVRHRCRLLLSNSVSLALTSFGNNLMLPFLYYSHKNKLADDSVGRSLFSSSLFFSLSFLHSWWFSSVRVLDKENERVWNLTVKQKRIDEPEGRRRGLKRGRLRIAKEGKWRRKKHTLTHTYVNGIYESNMCFRRRDKEFPW